MGKKQTNIFLVILITSMLAIGFRTAMKGDPLLDSKPPIMDEDQSQEPMVIGTLEIKEGDMLERDIIPQLSLVFGLSELEVKAILALPLESYLIRDGLTDFRRMEGILPPGQFEITEGETLVEWSKGIVEVAEQRYTDLLAYKAEQSFKTG